MAITEIISIVLGALTILLGIILTLIDTKLTKKEKLENIIASLPTIITKVEQIFGGGNGDLKKEYALIEVQKACIASKLKIDDATIENLSQKIEEILTTPQKKEIET